ncbi:hypothetical protein [Kitasatospora sp. GAS204B]|uniref:ParB and winged helix-turn-helix domain-containing protein n=1 Tax=unclassified Kitasatospora TaxID=2633591 RepID=UPI002473F2BB|nr:hypothetical protein [Kitasatospora sp. GAS204B]MDH6122045.1 transposase [Kitasatospora sp. GAS204B]
MTSGIGESATESLWPAPARATATELQAVPDGGRLPLAAVRPGDSPRFTPLDEAHAARLAALDVELPPILVHRPTMRVVDGAHRLHAAALRGELTIAVEYVDGPAEAAFIRAVAANLTGGLPLSAAERKAAAERIVRSRPERSDRSIAQHVGLSAKTVGQIRRRSAGAQSGARVGRDGRLRPVNPDEGRRRVLKVISERPGASLREIAQAAGVSLGTAHGVRSRVDRGDPALPARAEAPAGPPAPARTAAPARMPARIPAPVPAAVRPQPRPATAPTPPAQPEPIRRLAQRRLPGGYPVPAVAPAGTATAFARLAVLRRDPSLRFTDHGRALLLWLQRRLFAVSAAERELQDIPPHLLPVVADLALECAEGWRELADQLRGRARQIG